MITAKKDYTVGYGKPPAANQFVKGQSGNSKGRPKGSKNVASMFSSILSELVSVQENGRSKLMTRKEAIFRQQINKALAGDQRALNVCIQLARDFEELDRLTGNTELPKEREKAVFKSVLKRMQRLAKAEMVLSQERREP